jgi:hypothetical protein
LLCCGADRQSQLSISVRMQASCVARSAVVSHSIGKAYVRSSGSANKGLLDSCGPHAARRGAPSSRTRARGHPIGRHDDDNATFHRFRFSDIASACVLDDRSIALASETASSNRHIGLHALHADAKQAKAEQADWRRRRKLPTGPSSTGEGRECVYYVPARPRPLGEHGVEPHGLRFTRLFRASRIVAVRLSRVRHGPLGVDRYVCPGCGVSCGGWRTFFGPFLSLNKKKPLSQ